MLSVRLITYSELYSNGCTFFGTEYVFNVVEKVKSLHQNRQSDRSHRPPNDCLVFMSFVNSQECPFPYIHKVQTIVFSSHHNSTKCWTRVFLVFRMQIVAVQLLIHCFFLVLLSFLLKNMTYLHWLRINETAHRDFCCCR